MVLTEYKNIRAKMDGNCGGNGLWCLVESGSSSAVRFGLSKVRFPDHEAIGFLDYELEQAGLLPMKEDFHDTVGQCHVPLMRSDCALALVCMGKSCEAWAKLACPVQAVKIAEILIKMFRRLTLSERYEVCSDRRLWSECKAWFVGKVVHILLDNQLLHTTDECVVTLHSGEFRPTPSYVRAVKTPVQEPLVPRVHPAVKVAELTRDQRRKFVRQAECEGLICKWCGVVNFPKWGHLPLCMRPLSIPYDHSNLFENRHSQESVDLHVGLTVRAHETMFDLVDNLRDLKHTVCLDEGSKETIASLRDVNVNVKFSNPLSSVFKQVQDLFAGFMSSLRELPTYFVTLIRNVPVLALWLYNKVTKTLPEFVASALRFLWHVDPTEPLEMNPFATNEAQSAVDAAPVVPTFPLDLLEVEINDPAQVKLHAGGTDALFIAGMAFVLFPAVKQFWSKPDLKKLIGTCIVIPKLIGSWAEFSEWFSESFMSVVSTVTEQFGVKLQCKRNLVLSVQAFHDECVKFASEMRAGTLELDLNATRTYQRLEMTGCELYIKHNQDGGLRKALSFALRELRDVGVLLNAFVASAQGMRVAPSVLAIFGKPGIGKSVMLPALCNDILCRRLSKQRFTMMGGDLGAEIYTHDGGKFWNGYRGQELMLMDDAFQKIVVSGQQDDEYNEFIKLVSNAPKPLDKADLMSKGKFHFCSNGIVITTNNDNMGPLVSKVCVEVDAVRRRINGFEFVLKKKWMKPGTTYLDYDKFLAAVEDPTPRKYCTPNAWKVYKVDLVTKKHLSPEKKKEVKLKNGIHDVIDMFVGQMQKFTVGFDSLQAAIRKWTASAYEVGLQGPTMNSVLAAAATIVGGYALGKPLVDATEECNTYETNGPVDKLHCWITCYQESLKDMLSSPFVKYSAAIMMAIPIFGAVLSGINYLFRVLFTGAGSGPPKLKSSKKCLPAQADWRQWCCENLADSDFYLPGTTEARVGPHVLSNALHRMQQCTLNACQIPCPIATDKCYLGGAVDESQMTQSVIDAVKRNTYYMSVTVGGEVKQFGNVLVLAGRMAVMNKHFVYILRNFDPSCIVKLVGCFNVSYVQTTTVGSLLACVRHVADKADAAFVEMTMLPCGRDLSKYTLTNLEQRSIGRTRAVLVVSNENEVTRHYTYARFDGLIQPHSFIGEYQDVWFYAADTRPGDCGSMLVMCENPRQQNRRLLGFHMGAHPATSQSLSVAVTSEIVEFAKSFITKPIVGDSEANLHGVELVEDKSVVPLLGCFIPYRRVVGQYHPMANTTKKHRVEPMIAALKDVHTLTRKPAYLRPFKTLSGAYINPFDNAYSKLAPNNHWIHKPLLFRAVERVRTHLRLSVPRPECGVLTPLQALEGIKIPGCRLEPINRSSGPGFPYCLSGSKMKSKRTMTAGSDGCSYELSPELLERINLILEEAKAGRRCEHIYVDFLKDELRPVEKVDEGKSRLISSCPLDLTLVTRMYFGSFVGAMMANCAPHHNSRIAVGINPFADWDVLTRSVMRKGGVYGGTCPVIAGDFSGFDATEIQEVHEHILDIINSWYNDGEENALVRRVLWMEVMQSRHLTLGVDGIRNVIVEWVRSLPSGHPLTSIINSIYNMITFVYCFIKRVPETYDFFTSTCIYFYGDDNWGSVDPELVDLFNQQTIQADAIDLGLKYTDDSKSGVIAKLQNLEDTTFLKRRAWFDSRTNKWYGALDLASTLEICCWTKEESPDAIMNNIERTMYELSFSPIEVWNKYAPIVNKAAGEYYPECVAPGSGMDAYDYWRCRAQDQAVHF